MKEAERLIAAYMRACAEAGDELGSERSDEARAAADAAEAALMNYIRKLVEAQPAAVAGEAVLVPRKLAWDILGLLSQECAPCAEPECRISSNPEALITQCREQLYPLLAAPAAPLVGEPTTRAPCDCPVCTGSEKPWRSASLDRALPVTALAHFTFESVIAEGHKAEGANIVNGVPWAFKWHGLTFTHENADCYLVGLSEQPWVLRFDRGDLLWVNQQGQAQVQKAAASPAAPAGVPIPEGWEDHFAKVASMEQRPNSFHRSTADSSEASGSAIPARPTLPGELHAAMMNLPCKPYDGTDAYNHYCRGHRDARHAAAELVSALLAGGDQKAVPLHPSSVQVQPTDEQVTVALRAACLHDTRESRKDMRNALVAAMAIHPSSVQAVDGDEPTPYKTLYYELLYAVGNKYPGETRHQTALRYIHERETASSASSGADMKKPGQ